MWNEHDRRLPNSNWAFGFRDILSWSWPKVHFLTENRRIVGRLATIEISPLWLAKPPWRFLSKSYLSEHDSGCCLQWFLCVRARSPSLNRHIFTQEMLVQPGNNREPCLMSALYICAVIILPWWAENINSSASRSPDLTQQWANREVQWVQYTESTRKDFKPTNNSSVCSNHFTLGRFSPRMPTLRHERRLVWLRGRRVNTARRQLCRYSLIYTSMLFQHEPQIRSMANTLRLTFLEIWSHLPSVACLVNVQAFSLGLEDCT